MSYDDSVRDYDRSHTRKWRIPDLFSDLDELKLQTLYAYFIELIHFNGRVNLISPTSEENADIVHFADCIMAARIILNDNNSKQIYDVGSGNGLPGVVIAILDPSRNVVCVEKDAKKSEFLRHLRSRLALDNIDIVQQQVQELPPDSMDCIVSRAFAPLSNALLSTRKVLKVGSAYYHMKSDSWSSEAARIPSQAIPYWKTHLLDEYVLPVLGNHYFIVKTERVK